MFSCSIHDEKISSDEMKVAPPHWLRFAWIIALWVKRVTWIKRCQKLAKVDLCFSFNKLTRWYLLHFLSWLWSIFSTEKKWMTLVQKICPKLQQMYKNVEDGLVRSWSFVGWKYWPCREEEKTCPLSMGLNRQASSSHNQSSLVLVSDCQIRS